MYKDFDYILRREYFGYLLFNPQKKHVRGMKKREGDYFLSKNKKKKKILVLENIQVSGALTIPIKIFLDITNRCNLCCKHCLSSSGTQNIQELSFRDIKTLADSLVKMGVFKIKIGGGEPFLHSEIWDIFEYLSKCGFLISVSTNGTIINERLAKRIKDFKIKISVSIDGQESTHDNLRVSGSYKKAVRALAALQNVGLEPTIRTTLYDGKSSNLEDMIWLAKFASQKKVVLKIRRTRPAGRAIDNNMIFSRPSKRFWEIIKALNKFSNVDLEDIFNLKSKRSNIFGVWFDCRGGTSSAYVSVGGKISPCVFLGEDFFSGNIKTNSFISVWRNGRGFQKIREIFAKGNPLCQKCPRNLICKGECRAIAHFATGDWQANDPCCPIINKIV